MRTAGAVLQLCEGDTPRPQPRCPPRPGERGRALRGPRLPAFHRSVLRGGRGSAALPRRPARRGWGCPGRGLWRLPGEGAEGLHRGTGAGSVTAPQRPSLLPGRAERRHTGTAAGLLRSAPRPALPAPPVRGEPAPEGSVLPLWRSGAPRSPRPRCGQEWPATRAKLARNSLPPRHQRLQRALGAAGAGPAACSAGRSGESLPAGGWARVAAGGRCRSVCAEPGLLPARERSRASVLPPSVRCEARRQSRLPKALVVTCAQ